MGNHAPLGPEHGQTLEKPRYRGTEDRQKAFPPWESRLGSWSLSYALYNMPNDHGQTEPPKRNKTGAVADGS
jgi:hypothetical protein